MTELNIKPLRNMVVIKPILQEKKTSTGLFIPDNILDKEKPQEGYVIAVGPGEKNKEMSVKNKDKVLYRKYSGTEFEYNNDTYLIISEDDIYAIISNNNK
jgi:chaperonin GroES